MNVIVSTATERLVVPRTIQTETLFPKAPQLDDKRLVVPHGVRESILLRRIGVRIPAPILSYYDWKGGTPFSVQKATCAMLTGQPRAYVLNAMGTGKTKAALWSWDYLHSKGCAGKLLVVAPLSTLNFVWARECFQTLPHRKVSVLHGTKSQRLAKLANIADIYVINHDGLKTIAEDLTKRLDIDTLVIDELAVYRNNSERSKLMRVFAQRFEWVWGMTGSPMPNEVTDVWGQAKIITPTRVPKYFRQAQQLLMIKVNEAPPIWKPKANAVQTAFDILQPSVRYTLDDVTELPDAVERTIDVPLSHEQEKVYSRMAKEMYAMVQNKEITAVNAGAAMNKLLQVSLGWVYTANPAFVTLDKPRQDILLELIEEAERKVIIFVPYRHAIEGYADILKTAKISHLVVHGGTHNKMRDLHFASSQDEDTHRCLLCHPTCVRHGLTLTAADTTIWAGPVTSLETYEQANGRIRRVGQKHKQQFLHLQATPVERRVYGLLRNKELQQTNLLTLLEQATGEAK